MSSDYRFLQHVARRVASASPSADAAASPSILTVAAGSYGFRLSDDDSTMPTGFDPHAAALFESTVEAAYLVATADGSFDVAEQEAFRTVVVEACRGAVSAALLDSLLADLADQLHEDGLDKRIEMVARTIRRADQQQDVLAIAAFLAYTSGGISQAERAVIDKLARAFGLAQDVLETVLARVQQAMREVAQSAPTI